MSVVATALTLDRTPAISREGEGGGPLSIAASETASLSIVVPTFNEAGNIEELLRRLVVCLNGIDWEIVVVDDDSPDGTAHLVDRIALSDPRIHCLKRVGRRGLSSACLEGMAISRGTFLAVIDADLQHDENLLPDMLSALTEGAVDLVVGSRYMAGGGVAAWSRRRRLLSRAATSATHRLLSCDLTDPMSGFFMIRRTAVRQAAAYLSDSGFKLLLDLVGCSPTTLRTLELPYTFSARTRGQSKLDAGVAWSFARLLLRQAVRRSCGRFCHFCLIGTSGVCLHFAVLWASEVLAGLSFPMAQTIAVIVSLVSNYTLNNRLTFEASRLRGREFVTGLSRFAALCALGAIVNVVVADAILHVSGWRLSAAAVGILTGAVCNYCTTSLLVWRREQVRG